MRSPHTLGSPVVAELEVYYDNLYCFNCRSKMSELVVHKAYKCNCGFRCINAAVEAQVIAGWRLCDDCKGEKCSSCGYLGIQLKSQEG